MSIDKCVGRKRAVVFMRSEGEAKRYFAKFFKEGEEKVIGASLEPDQLAYWLAEIPAVKEPVNDNNNISYEEGTKKSRLSEQEFFKLNESFQRYRQELQKFKTD